ncbi:MAG: hypothetical protein KJZ58_07335 [Flavobacteriales bacterium]|nr:hypothetical protein [Flavobacteriales bacterium]MCL4282061.1 hypothetical protein [Flavobacteriales bacterium]
MEAWHAMAVMSAGMLKFLFSPIVSYQFGHNYLETVLLTGLGGGLGMLIFFRGGQQVLEWFRKRSLRRRAEAVAQGKPAKRVFTRSNRMIVRLKGMYGLYGVAFILTPILSVPLTALVAAKYFRHDERTLPALLSAVVVWSFLLSALWKFTD